MDVPFLPPKVITRLLSVARTALPVSLALALIGMLSSLSAPRVTDGGSPPARSQVTPAGRYLGLLPTSDNFIPIAVWDQAPNGGNIPSRYADQAQAFAAMGINIFVGMNDWPESFGSDDGQLAAAVAAKMYVIGGGDPASDHSPESVASIAKLIAKTPGASKYFIGYQWGDEPLCTTDVPAQVANVEREDPRRMVFENEGAWVAWLPLNVVGDTRCLIRSEVNLKAPSIASADEYALTDPWHSYLCPRTRDRGYDCLWVYGQEAQNLRAVVGAKTPVWEFVETGTNDLGLSSENGGKSEESSASPVQVNSAAWLALLNGANGIEWFCDELKSDGTPIWDYCASNGTIRRNLTYIDHTIEGYAPEINAPDLRNVVTVRSSDSALPIVADVKHVAGVTYLMVEGDRLGATTGTYTLPDYASGRAIVVYDSNTNYDPSVSQQGRTIAINALGVFSDSLPASYSVKIYEILPLRS
jgi:hypothetical protein